MENTQPGAINRPPLPTSPFVLVQSPFAPFQILSFTRLNLPENGRRLNNCCSKFRKHPSGREYSALQSGCPEFDHFSNYSK